MTPVAVCIVSFRDPVVVRGCLDALANSTFADFEIVICENGGPDAHKALRAAIPETALPGGQAIQIDLAPGNIGYAGGVNWGMRARPDARAWWVLNPDTRPEADALGALMRRLDRGDCAGAGGVLYHPGGMIQAYGGRWRAPLARCESIGYGGRIEDEPDIAAVERETNYIPGASMLIGREMVERVGLMREDYFLYAEEVEWCLRAGNAGLRFGFAADARVCHGQGATTGSADEITLRPRMPIYLDERNKLNVVRDANPGWLAVAIPASLVLGLLRFARRGAWRQQGYALSGWWAGVRNRRGLPPWMGG